MEREGAGSFGLSFGSTCKGRNPWVRQGRSGNRRLNDKSRMNGDVHVRFCEGAGVKFPRATRPFEHCILTYLDMSRYNARMAAIKISSKVEKEQWQALQNLAKESHQSIAGLLTEAISDFVRKRRLRPVVLDHLDESMLENEELGKRLAE